MEFSEIGCMTKHKYNTRSKNGKKRKYYKEESTDEEVYKIENIKEENKIINDNSNIIFNIKTNKLAKLLTEDFKIIKKLKKKPNTSFIIYDTNYLNKKEEYEKSHHQESEDEEYEDEEYEDEEYEDEESKDEESEDEQSEHQESQHEESQHEGSEDDKSYNKNKLIDNEIHKILCKKKKKNNLLDDLVKIANKLKEHNNLKEKREEIKKRNKNVKLFKELNQEKDNLDDLKYFKEKVEINKQESLIDEMQKVNKEYTIEKPYKIILLESDIPTTFKVAALKKITMMENMDPSVSEYFKLKNWIDTFMRIPFNKYSELPVKFNNGLNQCNIFMENAMKILNEAVYGLDDAKMQIMQLIGQWIVNPNAIGTALALKGPMGTGKTTLIQHGLSKILNRPFQLIPLGGATDAAFLEGHGYTYEGSTWGKIVDILIQTKSSNPIIYFDELDKVSDTAKGEEIISILTHLIDTTQNTNFQDKYFSEIDFNLSKSLFIFSYNDESRVNPILRDRMYKISTKGYELKDKKIIANNYLIPYICKQVNIKSDEVIISEESLDYIIKNYTEDEAGVRNLKRCIEIIFTKINLFRLMKPDSNLFDKEKCLKVEFPFNVTEKVIEKIMPKDKGIENDNWKRMYM